MGAVLDLDAPFDDDDTAEPVCEFTFGGRQWLTLPREDIPLRVFTADGMSSLDFFDAILVEDQRADFVKLLSAKDTSLTLRHLNRAVRQVSEQVLGFPTPPVAVSKPGTATTKPKRVAASSPKATPRRHSA